MPDIETMFVFREQRTRTDDAHITLEDTPEIEQLIEGGLPNKFAPRSYAFFRGKQIAIFILCLGHVPELQKNEFLAVAANTVLLEHEWTTHIKERYSTHDNVDWKRKEIATSRIRFPCLA